MKLKFTNLFSIVILESKKKKVKKKKEDILKSNWEDEWSHIIGHQGLKFHKNPNILMETLTLSLLTLAKHDRKEKGHWRPLILLFCSTGE